MQEITHTDQEREYLAKPLIHKTNVHRQKWSLFVGIGFFLYGFGWLARGATPISITCFALEIIVFIFMFVWLATPCDCGKIPLFTATARLKIMKQKNRAYEAIQYIIAATIVAAILLPMYLAVQTLGLQTAQICHGGVIAAVGCAILIAGALNKLPRSLSVIPEKEIQEIGAFNRATEKGLNRLIAFHLKAGNFVEADVCSKMLIELAERDSSGNTKT